MDEVADLLAGYPFDVLLGSVHWLGAWRFDDLDDPVSMGEWSARQVDACWDTYTGALEELAASGACDVLAHPDLIKVAGHRPDSPAEWWDRIAEAASSSGMAAEVSSAGWRKPAAEQYPAQGLLARFAAAGVPLTTASDAHRLEHVADHADSLRALLGTVGVDALQGYTARAPRPVAVGVPPSAPARPTAPQPPGRGLGVVAMPTPAELAVSHTELEPEALEHLQRLMGSWSVLADLSFSDLLLLVPVAGAARPRADRGPRAGGDGPDAAEQPAHPGRAGPGRPDGQRVAVGPGGPVPAHRRDRAGQHPPPDHRRAGAGGEHPGAVTRAR